MDGVAYFRAGELGVTLAKAEHQPLGVAIDQGKFAGGHWSYFAVANWASADGAVVCLSFADILLGEGLQLLITLSGLQVEVAHIQIRESAHGQALWVGGGRGVITGEKE